jgi:hypothetical protein
MTTVVPFIPSNLQAYEFPVKLDGGDYQIKITWNISAQRYYVNVYGNDGSWIITTPLVMSPPGRSIQLVKYNPFRLVLEVTMVSPEYWPIPLSPGGLATAPGTVIDYTLEGFNPTTYNGKFRGLHINGTQFTVPMAVDPGPVVVIGHVSRDLNMVAGVFKTSTLVYRNGAFEIKP